MVAFDLKRHVMTSPTLKTTKIKLWDWPIRLFHWSLAASVSFMFYSGYTGNLMEQHIKVGQGVLALVVFRIIWGFIGSTPTRFGSFLQSPAAALEHLREFLARKLPTEAGHNALGGYVVVAMILLTGLQALSGLYVSDDIFLEGPLYKTATESLADWMNSIHHTNWRILGTLIVLHPLAIAAYRFWGGQNLLTPMITGRLKWPKALTAPVYEFKEFWFVVGTAAAAAAVVYGGIALLS